METCKSHTHTQKKRWFIVSPFLSRILYGIMIFECAYLLFLHLTKSLLACC